MPDVRLSARVQATPRSASSGQFIAARITPAVRAAVDASCGFVAQEAQRLVPVRTGELYRSIGYEVTDGERTVMGNVYASAGHAGYVEFGTGIRGASGPMPGPYPYSPAWSGMEAQPFLRPALELARDAIREVFASQVSLALRT